MRHKKNEILDLIDKYRINFLAIQETKQSGDYHTTLPNFNILSKDGHFNRTQHGGVSLYIHSDVPYQEIIINSPLQVVAAVVQTNIRFSICNIYCPPSQNIDQSLLKQVYDELPKPCMILGDFNHCPLY